jgi:competence protein ComEC
MRLAYLGLSWISGVWLGMWAGLHWAAVAAAALLSVFAVLLRRRRALLLVLCLGAMAGGMLRFECSLPRVDENALEFYNGRGTFRIEGVVADDPTQSGGAVALRIDARAIDLGEGWRPVSGAALVYAPRYVPAGSLPPDLSRDPPYYRFGDVLLVIGEPTAPQKAEHRDWGDYLVRQGVGSLITYPESIVFLEAGRGPSLSGMLYGLRGRMSAALASALHEPQGSLAQAVLLGKREGIPNELRESLSRTGTSHIVAVSGLHIGIVGGIVLGTGVWLFGRRRPTYFLLAVAAVWAFALLTGLHAPALRAAIMVSLWLFADFIGRPRSALPVLLLAAALMVGLRPTLLSDVSFQLSFAAMAGLVLLTPRLQAVGRRICRIGDEEGGLVTFVIDGVAVTTGAVLATFPIIAFHFHTVSLVSLPANLLVLPALPGVVASAGLVGVVGLFAPSAAQILGWVAWILISYMVEVIECCSLLPFSHIDVEPGAPLVWGYYAVLGVALWVAGRKESARAAARSARIAVLALRSRTRRVPARYVLLPLTVVSALIWTAAVTAPDDRLHVFFLDVGQGDAILLQKGHTQILIDGGPDPEKLCVELGERLPFWDRTIELVILTHPEADHLTGLLEVLRRYEVSRVLAAEHENATVIYEEWLMLVEAEPAGLTPALAGQRIDMGGGVVLEVLNPPSVVPQKTSSDLNNGSVVARLTHRDFSLLLTGDIFEEAERYVLDRSGSLRSTVLKVAHHGSDTSSCPEFLSAVRPQIAVISVGADNRFGHPGVSVIERLEGLVGEGSVYLTSESGTVELITDGERLWLRTEK